MAEEGNDDQRQFATPQEEAIIDNFLNRFPPRKDNDWPEQDKIRDGLFGIRANANVERELGLFKVGDQTLEQTRTNLANTVISAENRYRQTQTQIEQLTGKVLFDQLTGLPNETFFKDVIGKLIEKGDKFGVLYLDADNFKAINEHGHDVGDEALAHLGQSADRALSEIQNYDGNDPEIVELQSLLSGAIAYRFHGDEFGLTIPNANSAEQTKKAAEYIRLYIQDNQFRSEIKPEEKLQLTVSIGGGVFEGSTNDQFSKFKGEIDEKALMQGAKKTKNTSVIIDVPMAPDSMQPKPAQPTEAA